MTITLRHPAREHIAELGRILFEAFRDIAETHGFPPDFESLELSQRVVGMMIREEGIYKIAAFDGDAPRASNFMTLWGGFAGIGPVSVDIDAQGGGIGRRIMLDALAHARESGVEMVRLVQDAFNMRSLALYASLGFNVKEPIAYMDLAADAAVSTTCRPMMPEDLAPADDLCRDIYRVSRRGECEVLMRIGMPAFVVCPGGGGIAGYLVGTSLGHGVARDDATMLALLATMGARVPHATAHIPMRNAALYRGALAAGHRNRKIVNLMAHGPYEDPTGPYIASALG